MQERLDVQRIPLVGVWLKWTNATSADARCRLRLPAEIWHDAFPMVIEEPKTGVLIYALDSNARGNHLIDNAFGHIAFDHLVRLRLLQRHFGDRPSLFLLHHHVALPPATIHQVGRRPKDALMRRFMLLNNSSALIAALPRTRPAVIFHGHRHMSYLGRLGEHLQIVSAPSTTLGDETHGAVKRGPGYFTFGMAVTSGGGAELRDRQWIAC